MWQRLTRTASAVGGVAASGGDGPSPLAIAAGIGVTLFVMLLVTIA